MLLERIREHGSISAAARSMEMSYRHAWKLVDSMNRQSLHPVVEKSTGGRFGGGARLTKAGDEAIDCFWSAYRDFKRFLIDRSRQLDL
ncbi:MAG: LysR family transcriptional regulator [Candidatus Scalindua sp.]|nr:LysR family transcriptional regulator [Candidatus Scalindua sp.]